MDLRTAIATLDGIVSAEDRRTVTTIETIVAEHLAAFHRSLDEDEEYQFGDGEAAALFCLCETLRNSADRIERELLRELKWGGEGMTWEQVAEAVDGQIGGRQAMQKRWSRLTDAGRRTTSGNMRRGAAARRSAVADVDTTTAAE